jgi:hypothetical protein
MIGVDEDKVLPSDREWADGPFRSLFTYEDKVPKDLPVPVQVFQCPYIF